MLLVLAVFAFDANSIEHKIVFVAIEVMQYKLSGAR